MSGAMRPIDVFLELLQLGVTALHFDARADGVRVPPWLRDRAWLVLNFSYRYNLSDFTVDEEAVGASLSFSGRPYPCHVPWSAVFAVSDAAQTRMLLWPDKIPSDQMAQMLPPSLVAALPPGAVLEQTPEGMQLHQGAGAAAPAATPPAPRRAALRVITSAPEPGIPEAGGAEDAADATAAADEPPPEEPPPTPARSHLRVVK